MVLVTQCPGLQDLGRASLGPDVLSILEGCRGDALWGPSPLHPNSQPAGLTPRVGRHQGAVPACPQRAAKQPHVCFSPSSRRCSAHSINFHVPLWIAGGLWLGSRGDDPSPWQPGLKAGITFPPSLLEQHSVPWRAHPQTHTLWIFFGS